MGKLVGLTGYSKAAVVTIYNKDYYFAIYEDGNDYHIGDKIIVSGVTTGILTIKEIITSEEAHYRFNKDLLAEVIGKIDTSAYDERVRKRKEAEKLKRDMDKVIKQMDDTRKYEMYAEKSPELAEMLSAYKKLVEI